MKLHFFFFLICTWYVNIYGPPAQLNTRGELEPKTLLLPRTSLASDFLMSRNQAIKTDPPPFIETPKGTKEIKNLAAE